MLRNSIRLHSMFQEDEGEWRAAVVVSITRKEVAFVVESGVVPRGAIRLMIVGRTKGLQFRGICCATVDETVQNGPEVRAVVRSWELIKPKRNDGIPEPALSFLP